MEQLKKLYIKYKEIMNYVIVGALTTLVSLVSYYACVLTVFDPHDAVLLQTANVISWICAVTFAYFTNRKFVFESKAENRLAEAGRFFGARIMTLLIDMACMALFVTLLGFNDKISKFAVQFIVLALNYVFSKFLVFKK